MSKKLLQNQGPPPFGPQLLSRLLFTLFFVSKIIPARAWPSAGGAYASSGWQLLTGSSDVVVAIIDTGVDLDHPDLRSSLWINKGEIPGNGIDDDNNGYIDDVHGYDFAGYCAGGRRSDGSCSSVCSGRGAAYDDNGHGTHIAGIVAATQNNAIGGSGVSPGIKIMVLRVS